MPNFETFARNLEIKLQRGVEAQRGQIAADLEGVVRENIRSGKNTGKYSTRAGWFSLTPGGRTGKAGRLAAEADKRKRLRRPNRGDSSGVGIANAGYFEKGYAQYRAEYRGEGFRSSPVTFQFTGEMMRNLRGVSRRTAKGQATAYLGFRRQKRSYGRITNRELAEILSRRSGRLSPFQPTQQQGREILSRASARAKTAR